MTREKKAFNLRLALVAGTAAILLLLQAAALSPNIATPIEDMEYAARDLFMRLRGVDKPSGEIVIVAVDDFSFSWTGFRWPWSRSYFAGIVDQVNAGGGKVVGVDLILFEPDEDPENDEVLARALGESRAAASVIQIVKSSGEGFAAESLLQPLSVYRQALDGSGITSTKRDEDAIVRSVHAFDTYQGAHYYHWAFDVARLYLGSEPPSALAASSLQFNGQSVPLYDGRLVVNYAGPAGTYPTYSASDVHDGVTLQQDPDAFRDKIVLIGATTVTLQDIHPTPFSATVPTPGVEIVANTVDTIIHAKYIRLAPGWLAFLITAVAAFLAYLISRSQRPTLTVALLIVGMAGYLAAGFLLFITQRYVLPIVAPQIMLFLGVILPSLEQAVSQELEKRRVRNLFSRFISPEMVDQMIATQDLSSLNKRANLTILFSDIRGFTTLSEKLPPEEVVALLNPYLEAMSREIYRHGGTVDKYEGDAIIAFFGEPVPYEDHAARALRAALDMRKSLANLREKWAREGRPSQIEMGIGINSGEVFVGLLGSEQRINYTVIGDNANLASRLQDLTKTYSWPILISESTYQLVSGEFDAELVDAVTVKGKTRPVNVYKVAGRRGAPASEKIKAWQ